MQLSADEVKAKRQELGLTQKEFAAALGMGPNGERTVRRWEAGETRPTAAESKYISTLGHRAPFAPAGGGEACLHLHRPVRGHRRDPHAVPGAGRQVRLLLRVG